MPFAHSSTPPQPASTSPIHHTRPHQTAARANCPAPPPKTPAPPNHSSTSRCALTADRLAVHPHGEPPAHQTRLQSSPAALHHMSALQWRCANTAVSPVQTNPAPGLLPIPHRPGFCPHRDHPRQANCETQFPEAAVVAPASPSKATGGSALPPRSASAAMTGACFAQELRSRSSLSASC